MNNPSNKKSDPEKTLGQLLDEKSIELQHPVGDVLSGDTAGPNDIPDEVDRAGNEVENGPIDIEDPNLSATMAEAGATESREELGMKDEDEMKLDDPENQDVL